MKSKQKNKNTQIISLYKKYTKEIKILKDNIIDDFILKLKENDIQTVSIWIDYRVPNLYKDIFLVYYNGYFHNLTFSAGSIFVETEKNKFGVFETLLDSLKNIPYNKNNKGFKSKYGYYIDKTNHISNNKETDKHPQGNYIWKDLLRKNKIKNLLKKDIENII